jgi:D-alanine transfer protein
LHDEELAAAPARKPEAINWSKLIASAERQAQTFGAGPVDRTVRHFSSNQSFLDVIQNSGEWNDLELLLRVCRELDLEPLLVNIPMDSVHFRQMGVSQTSLDFYLQRLRELAGRYDAALVDFADHREDPWFLGDHHDHFSAKGWMFVNKELDGFFHAPGKHAQR